MAMIKCPDCKTPVSDLAECCPRCGCKFQSEYREMLWLRDSIASAECMQKRAGAKPGGCATAVLIIGVCLVLVGMWMFTLGNLMPLLGLAAIGGGGFLGLMGLISMNEPAHEQNRYNEMVDRTKADLPEKRRRLAQLEAKFR